MTGKKHEHIVKSIMPGSIAEELGIEPGDKLLSIDGQEIEDIFDYQFYVEDEEIEQDHFYKRGIPDRILSAS